MRWESICTGGDDAARGNEKLRGAPFSRHAAPVAAAVVGTGLVAANAAQAMQNHNLTKELTANAEAAKDKQKLADTWRKMYAEKLRAVENLNEEMAKLQQEMAQLKEDLEEAKKFPEPPVTPVGSSSPKKPPSGRSSLARRLFIHSPRKSTK